MKIRTATLIGPALNWAVAKCEGYQNQWLPGVPNSDNQYSTDWGQGGPVIGREGISTTDQHGCRGMERWLASLYLPDDNGLIMQWGPTHLIAAMRCLVNAKLGDMVEIPEELLT
jgi:hypothetical protein